MAVQQINLSDVGYLTSAGALGHTGPFDEITWIDDAVASTVYFTTFDNTATPPSSGLSNPFDGNVTDSQGNPTPGWYKTDTGDVIQIDSSGQQAGTFTTTLATTEATTTLATFLPADAEPVTVAAGLTGTSIVSQDVTIGGLGAFASANPTNYTLGISDYDINITVPSGFDNTGQEVTVTVTGVSVTELDSIAWDSGNTGNISVGSAGQDQNSQPSAPLEQYSMTGANGNLDGQDFELQNGTPNNAWDSGTPTIFLTNSSLTGGNIQIVIPPNPSNDSRSIEIRLQHPDDPSKVSAWRTITQAGSNAIPVAYDYTFNIPADTDPLEKELDFSSPTGWTGAGVVGDSDDSFGAGDLQIRILTAVNCTVEDVNGSGGALSLPAVISNGSNGAPTIKIIPDTDAAITNLVTYEAFDDSGDSDDGTISLVVQQAQNQAPIIQGGNEFTLPSVNVGDVYPSFNLGAYINATEETPAADLTYYISVNDNGAGLSGSGGTPMTAGNYTGQHGTLTVTIQNNVPPAFLYTSNITLGPNSNPSSLEDVFWVKVKDDGNPQLESNVASFEFVLSAAVNAAPVWNQNATQGEVQQFSTLTGNVNNNVFISDPDGSQNEITFTSTKTSGLIGSSFTLDANGSWTYNSATLNVPVNQFIVETYEITARDAFNDEATGGPFTLSIRVNGVGFITVNRSQFTGDGNTACNLNQGIIAYLDAAQAGSVAQLAIGHSIYTQIDSGNNTPTSPLIAPSNSNQWVSVQDGNSTKALQINSVGVIEGIINCNVTTGNAWQISVQFGNDENDICRGNYEEADVWQNIIDPDDVNNGLNGAQPTLSDIVTAGGQLFSNEYFANQYDGQTAPAGLLVPSGYYSDNSLQDNYFRLVGGNWTSQIATECADPIVYKTYSVDIWFNQNMPTSIDAACTGAGSVIADTLWFRADELATYNDTALDNTDNIGKLTYLLKNNIVVFTDEASAQMLDYDNLWPSTVFLADQNGAPLAQFAVWENDNSSGYIGNFRWKGDNPDTGDLEDALSTTNLANCTPRYERPVPNAAICLGLPNNECDVPSGFSTSRENVFYAFYSCEAKFEEGVPYWPMYIVDGLHTIEPGSSSYLEDLWDQIAPPVIMNGDNLIGCISLVHKIFAVNADDAISILNSQQEYQGINVRPVRVSGPDIGLTSGAEINYGYADCNTCILDGNFTNTYTLQTADDADIINRSIPNFDLESNYQLDDLSKPLLRTNPKLSTNAKLVVNSNGNMFIESIDATKELASVEYKKFSLNKDGQWAYDLQKFFKQSKTPSDQIYLTKKSYSDFSVQETFDKQIEEDYHYGTVYNYSKLHTEDFRMMAPIWLDKNIPSKFVIFRVNDPSALDFDAVSNLENMTTILNNSEIIKTFDLTRDSELGTYIRNHVQSESFPKNPLTINFDRNERSSFNGIDLSKGGFTSKGEYLYDDFVKKDQTIIAENNLITDGFQRNNLACANLINMEFLFNDNNVEDYGINRYFGLYVDNIDSGYGTLSSANNGLLKFKHLNSDINDSPNSAIPPHHLMASSPVLGYANVSDDFYKISPRQFYNSLNLEVRVEDGANNIPNEIKLAATGRSVEMTTNNNVGSDFIKVNVVENPAVNDRFAIFPSKEQLYRIQFKRYTVGNIFSFGITVNGALQNLFITLTEDLQTLVDTLNNTFSIISDNLVFEKESDDSMVVYEKRASLSPFEPSISSLGNNITIARIEELQVPYDLANNMFFGTDGLAPGHFNSTSFSNQGTLAEITSAIVKSINSVDNGFTALTYDKAEHFYIKTDVVGYRLLQAGIAIPDDNANNWISLDDANEDVDNLLRLNISDDSSDVLSNSNVYFFSGGNSANKSMLVSLDSVNDININDYIETKSIGIYNKVIDIVDDIERLPLQYKKVVLERDNTIDSGEINIFADNLVRLGLFSAYDIHDMNFDFYDTSNSKLKELQYETENEIAYEPERDQTNDIYPFGDIENTEYTIEPERYFTGLNDVLLEEQADEFKENIIQSEYDRLQENYLKEFAVDSRVIPNINKWVLKDTLTVREQPYYLNANEAFGRSNFSADLSFENRNRLGMTHEWFYVNNLPKHLTKNLGEDGADPIYRLNDSFSYINFMEGFEITPAIFKDTNYDYFDRFFVTEGFETKGDNNYKTFVKTNRQKKYTKIDGGNDIAFAETIFKGLKIKFKNRKEFTSDTPVDFIKSSEFNGYKFSILLNVKTAQESNDIEYEVIQNDKFKYVVFFISLSLDDLWADQTLTKKLLYELKHSLVWDNEAGTFKYSDIKLDGHLDFNSLNQTNDAADDYLILKGLQHADGSMPQFLEQINKNDDDAFGNIIVKLNTAFGEMTLRVNIEEIEGQDSIKLTQGVKNITDGDFGDGFDQNGDPLTPFIDLNTLPGYLQWNAEYIYIQGGINAYENILNALGIQNVAEMLLREPGSVKYTTVQTDGTIEQNKFIILIEDGVEIIKESFIITTEDEDKPESFKLSTSNIGYNLTNSFTYYPFLIRHNGGYTIDTTPVVTFTDIYAHMKTNTLQSTSNINEITLEERMYKHSLSDLSEIELAKDYYRRYNRCGVAFNLGFIYDGGTHDVQWGKIKNHFYRKVNEFNTAGITKLSTSTDKLPLYPLIGEIAIDKKDVHVFRSSWDKNYYTRALSGGLTEPVPGTFETKEEKSYLASTIMKTADNYELLQFKTEIVNSEEELDSILRNNTNKTDVVMFEDRERVLFDFYIDFTINRRLSEEGVLASITKYVLPIDSAEDKTTLKDDARLYISDNLVNAFGVNQIKLFTKRVKGVASTLENASTLDALDDGGFIADQNFSFKAHEQKPLNFRLIYNKRLGYSYRIRPMVKITS